MENYFKGNLGLGTMMKTIRRLFLNMTPMACGPMSPLGISDGNKDRLALPFSLLKGFWAPRIPIHWVMRMLE
jgi:hypothetical protein